jgi:hypothetical protein
MATYGRIPQVTIDSIPPPCDERQPEIESDELPTVRAYTPDRVALALAVVLDGIEGDAMIALALDDLTPCGPLRLSRELRVHVEGCEADYRVWAADALTATILDSWDRFETIVRAADDGGVS